MNFKCEHCGYCCTLIAKVNSKEIKTIEKLGHIKKDFLEKGCLRRTKEGDCFFLVRRGRKTKCKIYFNRPKVCRDYPPFEQNKPCQEFNHAVRGYLYWRKKK